MHVIIYHTFPLTTPVRHPQHQILSQLDKSHI